MPRIGIGALKGRNRVAPRRKPRLTRARQRFHFALVGGSQQEEESLPLPSCAIGFEGLASAEGKLTQRHFTSCQDKYCDVFCSIGRLPPTYPPSDERHMPEVFNSRAPHTAMFPGRSYSTIQKPWRIVFDTVFASLLGAVLIILDSQYIGFACLLVGMLAAIRALGQAYRLQIMESGAIEFTAVLSTIYVWPNTIHSISTGLQILWWGGGDARVIHITHDRGALSVPNFEGAEALFTEIIHNYPNIQASKLNFLPEY
jgi:hypothetical protein